MRATTISCMHAGLCTVVNGIQTESLTMTVPAAGCQDDKFPRPERTAMAPIQ